MDINNLRRQPVAALQKNLAEARNHLQSLRFSVSANQLKDVREIRESRRLIAAILTVLRSKENESK